MQFFCITAAMALVAYACAMSSEMNVKDERIEEVGLLEYSMSCSESTDTLLYSMTLIYCIA
jgi:hypothetical protein